MDERIVLHNICQDRDEPMRSFGTGQRGQADIYKFLIRCPRCLNYQDAIIRNVGRLEASSTQKSSSTSWEIKIHDITLKVFGFIAPSFLDSQSVDAASSTYRTTSKERGKWRAYVRVRARLDTCTYSGDLESVFFDAFCSIRQSKHPHSEKHHLSRSAP